MNDPATVLREVSRPLEVYGITLELTRDVAYLDAMFQKYGWPALRIDEIVPRHLASYAPQMADLNKYFVKVSVTQCPAGFVHVQCAGLVGYPHACLSPMCRGRQAQRVYRAGLRWAREALGLREFRSNAPSWCKSALAMAASCGFRITNRVADVYSRDGRKYDRIDFSI